MTDMGELQGSLPEAVGCAGYTLAVGLFDIMVRKGVMTAEAAWPSTSTSSPSDARHCAGRRA
jgi:hypothetical protein